MSAAQEEIRRCVQNAHDIRVWESLHRAALGWQSGSLTDHDSRRMAQLMGVTLRPPPFLDRVLAVLGDVKPDGAALSRKRGQT